MRCLLSARLALALWSSAVPFAGAQDKAPERASPSLIRAAVAVVGVNGLAWTYNRYVQHWDWSKVGPDTWWENLRTGFQWDDDALTDNQLAHPLQGSFYYNGARGAGFSFWASAPFVALGSLSWEFFAENVRASPNDVINTTLGGIALGELTSRMARLLSHRGREQSGLIPRLSAVAIDPVGRLQGWRWAEHDDASAPEQPRAAPWLAIGTGQGGDNPDGSFEKYRFLQLGLRYGNIFDAARVRPYDALDFGFELTQRGTWQVRRVHVTGLLARSAVRRTRTGELGLGFFQHYEFLAYPMTISGQSFSGALLYRRPMGPDLEAGLNLHLEAIVLGEIASEEGHARRRDYDYAPGFGTRLEAAIRRGGRDLIGIQSRAVWLYSVYGAAARHLVITTRVTGAIPIRSAAALGGEVSLTFRRSTYPVTVVYRRLPEIRAYVAWPSF
jgi:Domain of unknown function (DUF3943)